MRRYASLIDLENCWKISIWTQRSASIQKRTSRLKFARSPCTDLPGLRLRGVLEARAGSPGALPDPPDAESGHAPELGALLRWL